MNTENIEFTRKKNNLKNIKITLLFLLGLMWNVSAEEVFTGLIDFTQHSEIAWHISNQEGHTIYSSADFEGQDSAFFYLEGDQYYRLNIDVVERDERDTLWLNLELNASPIIVVLPEEELGEYSYPFFTGTKDPVMKIVGGTSVSIADYPWQIYLSAGDYMCGGTIIAKRWIVTAAHCTQDGYGQAISASDMMVVAGATNPYSSSSSHDYAVKSYTVHQYYNDNSLRNDIAVLELYEDIDLEDADVIELISVDDVNNGATDPGVIAEVTGWGLTRGTDNPTSIDYPNKLQMVQLPIVSNSTAADVWSSTHESFLFAGYKNGNKDACSGDSGGPLVVEVDGTYKLAGIVSWGSSNCDTYGAYTRVSYFLDWIEEQTGVTPGETMSSPIGDEQVCQGTVASDYYTSEASSGSYQWHLDPDTAGVLTYDENQATITWADGFSGMAELMVKGTVNGEETSWATSVIEVQKNTILYSSPTDTTICEDLNITFKVEADGDDLLYTWYKDGAFYRTSYDGTLTLEYLDPNHSGVYYCELNGSCGDTTTNTFTLTVLPKTLIETVSDDQFVSHNEDLQLTVSAQGDKLTYQWFKDGQAIDGATTDSLVLEDVNAKDIGTYQVWVNGTCESDSSEMIYLYVDQEVSNDVQGRVWPTVVSQGFYVAISTTDAYQIDIINIQGEVVMKQENLYLQQFIDVSHLSAGAYFVRILADSVLYTTQRIIIK